MTSDLKFSHTFFSYLHHNHKKRNSLDTRAVFIEFLKYVENSLLIIYEMDRSFNMASNSAELLADDNIEGILEVIDGDIYAELNNLEIEFTAIVSEIESINSGSCFLCQSCRKTYKTKRGLNRHQSAEHGEYAKIYEGRLPMDTFEQFAIICEQVKLANDQCFESFMEEFLAFLTDKECYQNVHKFNN